MCLRNVTTRKPEKKEGYGWKIFKIRQASLVGQFKNSYSIRPEGTWLDEKNYRELVDRERIKSERGKIMDYRTGWHIWATCPQPEVGRVVRRVRYRKAVAEGRQFDVRLKKVIVAKEIFIFD
jgi:hypothetical protein